MRKSRVKTLTLALAILFGLSYQAIAQDTFTASLEGKVVDSISEQSLIGIKVVLVEAELSDSTDSRGVFNFSDLTSSSFTIRIEHDDYEIYEEKITLEDGYNGVVIKLKAKQEMEEVQ